MNNAATATALRVTSPFALFFTNSSGRQSKVIVRPGTEIAVEVTEIPRHARVMWAVTVKGQTRRYNAVPRIILGNTGPV